MSDGTEGIDMVTARRNARVPDHADSARAGDLTRSINCFCTLVRN